MKETLSSRGAAVAVLDRPRRGHILLSLRERRGLVMVLDLVALNAALLLALGLRGYHVGWPLVSQHPLWFIVLSLVWLPIAHTFDAYDPRTVARFSAGALCVTEAGLLTIGVYVLLPYVTPSLPTTRSELVMLPLVTLALLLLGRRLYAVGHPLFRGRALVIGAGRAGRAIAEVLVGAGHGTYQLVGFVDDDPALRHEVVPLAPAPPGSGLEAQPFGVLGDRRALPELIARYRVTTLVLAISGELDGDLLQRLTDCLEAGVEVVPMTALYEQMTGRVPVEHVGDHWHVAMPIVHPGSRQGYLLLKRCLDVVLASAGLVVLGSLLPFIALAIVLDSPGPVFHAQRRVGKGGRLFSLYKFRSMTVDAEVGEARWAQEGDPRATRVGRVLRATHLDEFPQFVNVLTGEMSAVGPRPERPEFVAELTRQIPFYGVRHTVKPGMAGWALVKQGYSGTREDALVKLQYDLYSIKHQSLWLDLVILLKTLGDALSLRGR